MAEQLLESVKAKYGAVAESPLSGDHAGVRAVAEAFGYTPEELLSIPAEANMGLSCGNPTATAHLKPGGRLAVSDIALKRELPAELASSIAAYVGCIAGAILIDDYRAALLHAGFAHVEIVDSGKDLNAYAKIENQSGCCSSAKKDSTLFPIAPISCCSTSAPAADTLHEELGRLLAQYDINAAAASVKVYALKPAAQF